MKNAEWMVKNGCDFYGLDITQEDEETYVVWYYDDKLDTINLKENKFEALLAWLDMKHREPILDDAEKKYLSAVIKPFRSKIYTIVKWRSNSGDSEWLSFIGKVKQYYDEHGNLCTNNFGTFYLPSFKAGTMYKGMQVGRKYKLEELGI